MSVFVLVADDIVRLGLRGDSNARNFEALFLSSAVKFRAPAGTTTRRDTTPRDQSLAPPGEFPHLLKPLLARRVRDSPPLPSGRCIVYFVCYFRKYVPYTSFVHIRSVYHIPRFGFKVTHP